MRSVSERSRRAIVVGLLATCLAGQGVAAPAPKKSSPFAQLSVVGRLAAWVESRISGPPGQPAPPDDPEARDASTKSNRKRGGHD